MGLSIWDVTHKWNRTICGLQWLSSFTERDVSKVHPLCNVCLCFILFCALVTFHCVHGLHSICSALPPHPPPCWYLLGYFRFSVIMNNGCFSEDSHTEFWVAVCLHFFLYIFLGVELPAHVVTPYVTFRRTARLFSKAPTLVFVPSRNFVFFLTIDACL